jgi:hypothetical protein
VGWKEAAAIAHSSGAKFPYSHLRECLAARGFDHLVEMIPWSGTKPEASPEARPGTNRSRMFINVLKLRLQLVAPDKCGDIVRNEAHVRMMSSVWFATRNLSVICWISTLPVAAAVYYLWAVPHASRLSLRDALFSHDVLLYGALFLFVELSAFWLQRHVESCIHYQRFREVYYVLEAAFFLAHTGHAEILENLPQVVSPVRNGAAGRSPV